MLSHQLRSYALRSFLLPLTNIASARATMSTSVFSLPVPSAEPIKEESHLIVGPRAPPSSRNLARLRV